MNIHPLVVHFPIAFLSLYAVLECVRFRKVMDWAPFFYIKATLLFAGVLGGVAAVLAGEQAEKLYGETRLTELHASFGVVSVWIFGIIGLVYLIILLECLADQVPEKWRAVSHAKVKIARWIYAHILWIVAFGGLVCVMITGALGGALVYGPDVDPFVRVVVGLFK